MIALLPPWIALLSGCGSCRSEPDPCTQPQLWYGPESDEDVYWGCIPPAEDWRSDPFIEWVGPDLDGTLRGPEGVFMVPTADTGRGRVFLGPSVGNGQDTAPDPEDAWTGDTGDLLDTGFVTGDTATLESARSERAAGDTLAGADTGASGPGLADTGLDLATGDTSAPVGDTMQTADTGEIEPDPEASDTSEPLADEAAP